MATHINPDGKFSLTYYELQFCLKYTLEFVGKC